MLSIFRSRWLIAALAFVTAFAMECFFVRFPAPLSFLAVLAIYFASWAVIMTVHKTWRLRWALVGFVPVVLLAYAFLFRVDTDLWALEVLALGLISLVMTGFIPLKAEKGVLLKICSLPFVRHPLVLAGRGIEVIKTILQIRLEAGRTRQIVTGIIISVPLLFIFGALFYSADSVFREALDRLDWVKHVVDFISVSGLGKIIRFIIWFTALAGLWSYMIADDYLPFVRAPKIRVLPQTTVLVVIGLLCALFVAFNITQLVGLVFGSGLPVGTTYAAYAREGFAQLVVALFLAFILVWKLCYLYGREKLPRRVQIGLFVFLSQLIPLVFSSWHRLNLYQETYGFTLLRMFAEWAIVAGLCAVPLFVVVVLGKVRYERVAHIGLIGIIVCFSVVMAVSPSYLVASRNVDRFVAGSDLDVNYLSSLPPESFRAWTKLSDPALRSRLDALYPLGMARTNLTQRLKDVADALPYYSLSTREDGEGKFWYFHPGERRLKPIVQDLLSSFEKK